MIKSQKQHRALQRRALNGQKRTKRSRQVIAFTARMAERQDLCRESFTVILNKSEKLAYDHALNVPHIRTLLYCKALEACATSIDTIADDLQLSREEVISSIRQLRKTGFITTTEHSAQRQCHG